MANFSKKSLDRETVSEINKVLKPYKLRIQRGSTLRILVRRLMSRPVSEDTQFDPTLATVNYVNLPQLFKDTSWARDLTRVRTRQGSEGWHLYLNDQSTDFFKVQFIPPTIPEDDISKISSLILMFKLRNTAG